MDKLFHITLLSLFIQAICQDPKSDCPEFVNEGDTLLCICTPPDIKSLSHDYSLKWIQSGSTILKVPNVTRANTGKVFTCSMMLNGRQSFTHYQLKVAYGPASVTIEGPSTFVTDGLKPMTLKCNATDVYPSPVYTWDNIHCDSTNKNDACTFSPKGERDNGKEVVCTVTNGISTTKARYRLDLRYPPLLPPVLTSSSSENSIEKGDIITCSVSGGHPPVTSVTLGCSDPLLVYRLNTTEGSTRNTSLVFTTTSNTIESLLCYCHVLWEPDKGLYEHNVTHVFNIKATPGDPTTDCPEFVVEGETLNCYCLAPEAVKPRDFSLTWSDGRHSDNLVKNDVSRRHNNTLFKCSMTWNGETKTVSYTLRVAYGPGNVTIKGPSVFVTNGSRVMTLTCEASDVYPPPDYVWSGDVPCRTILRNVCRLTPKGSHHHGMKVRCTATSSFFVSRPVVVTDEYSLNLQYPPLLAPVLTSSSRENSIEKGDIITCTVSGGHPPVTSVTLWCSDPLLVYRLNTTEGSTHNTSLVIRTTSNTNEYLICYCHVLWEPDKSLYEHNVTRVFTIKTTPGVPTTDCPEFVVEGATLNCYCLAPEAVKPRDFSLTWSDERHSDNLVKNDVSRRHNNTLFNCSMTWNGEIKTVSYTLRVAYPPMIAPVLTSSSRENSIEKGDIITCSVSGGHPPVTSVTLWCSDPLLVYRLNTTEGSTRNTSLVFTTTPNTNESLLCYCHVLWKPDKSLYEHNVTRIFNIKRSSQQSKDTLSLLALLGGMVGILTIVSIIAGLAVYISRRKGLVGYDDACL
ncbi:uncharacterized protein LOC112567761 [Pomacea canaliculata]|uniref:uncharacterized protein LOC112567761 n=1 Tax=Pomacea canaliculata TaxID=400727 RepID=UPI000D72D7DD|nr:uncharacterized protein LOC112567761 [Pomacea canaliculata]